MPKADNWTRSQTLAAFHIYLQLPFGQLHQLNPRIKQLASWIDRKPGSVALKLVNLASLDPQIVASGRKGMGNASRLDKELWGELQSNWDAVALAAAAEYERFAADSGEPPGIDVADEMPEIVEGKTRSAVVQVRVNQVRFRRAVLASYNSTCCISGMRNERLLVASHIIPWSADTKNRLNPRNGLCLSALHDRAFDQGLITVLPNFTVAVSTELKCQKDDSSLLRALLACDKQPIRMPERFPPDPEMLKWHADHFRFSRISTNI